MTTTPNLDVLWDPLTVGSTTLRNRVFVSAHMMALSDEDIVGQRFIDYYEERARGGVGLLVTGAEGVMHSGWKRPHFQAWRADARPRYEALARAVHRHGAKVFTQLYHSGPQNPGITDLDQAAPPMAPSAIQSPAYGRIAKAMEQEDIEEAIAAFANAARLAQAAGIDGVEVSGGHGYLVNTFMSPYNNRRTDQWGGSIAGRARLAVEIGKAIRTACGPDFTVGMRMIFEEYVGPGGATPDDSGLLLDEIQRHGLYDYFSISGGTYQAQWVTISPMTAPFDRPFVDHAAQAKKIVAGSVPVAVANGIRTVATAAEIVAAGNADMVAMTRAHLADPFLLTKARSGRTNEIRRCVGANQGCVMRQAMGVMSSCTVNPAVGREGRWGSPQVTAAATPRHVQIVGGGPAGLQLAVVAAEHGHRVTLIEQQDELGGNLRLAAKIPHRARWADTVEDLREAVTRLGVDVRLRERATASSLIAGRADLTVIATGAVYERSGFSVFRPERAGIPGIDAQQVLTPDEAAENPEAAGRRVVVVDDFGDQMGVGIARLLATTGRAVHLVSVAPMVHMGGLGTLESPALTYPLMAKEGVVRMPSTTVVEMRAGAVDVVEVYTGETTTIQADTVVLNMLRSPVDALYLDLKAQGAVVTRIGDALAPRFADEAIYEGTEVGFDIDAAIAAARPRTPALA